MWGVTVHGVHGSQVLIAHVKHLSTLAVSQVGGAVLQGRSLFILIPIFLERTREKEPHTQPTFCILHYIEFSQKVS